MLVGVGCFIHPVRLQFFFVRATMSGGHTKAKDFVAKLLACGLAATARTPNGQHRPCKAREKKEVRIDRADLPSPLAVDWLHSVGLQVVHCKDSKGRRVCYMKSMEACNNDIELIFSAQFGWGVFATKDLPTGSRLCKMDRGERLDGFDYVEETIVCDDGTVTATFVTECVGISHYLNHGCDACCAVKLYDIDGQTRRLSPTLVVQQEVRAGQEILMSYGDVGLECPSCARDRQAFANRGADVNVLDQRFDELGLKSYSVIDVISGAADAHARPHVSTTVHHLSGHVQRGSTSRSHLRRPAQYRLSYDECQLSRNYHLTKL